MISTKYSIRIKNVPPSLGVRPTFWSDIASVFIKNRQQLKTTRLPTARKTKVLQLNGVSYTDRVTN